MFIVSNNSLYQAQQNSSTIQFQLKDKMNNFQLEPISSRYPAGAVLLKSDQQCSSYLTSYRQTDKLTQTDKGRQITSLKVAPQILYSPFGLDNKSTDCNV